MVFSGKESDIPSSARMKTLPGHGFWSFGLGLNYAFHPGGNNFK